MMDTQNAHAVKRPQEKFLAIGINYVKADAETRGRFSLSEVGQFAFLEEMKEVGFPSVSVISTCNRTEVYAIGDNPGTVISLLCKHTVGNEDEFRKVHYCYEDSKAISHLFRVGTGLDSQILGDFEIISQLRKSFQLSKKMGLLNAYMERLINAVIQASKRIKNETGISSGATSVSFAAVQYILARVPFVSEKNILLFGVGKIGRNTCENLIKHTRNKHISLINRTKVKAEEVAGKFSLLVKDYSNIQSEIAYSDILVVATGAQQPTINKELLFLKKPLLILDLSIPKNVSENVTENPLVTLVHLDELSQMTNQTFNQRKEQLPLAQSIIDEVEAEFQTWAQQREYAPTLKALKDKLAEIKTGELDFHKKKVEDFHEVHAELLADRLIHKITTQVASHLKQANGSSQESLALLKEVFNLEP
ncbi:MAG: glutamyl-tRNA reductase [Flavobacteriaceae bacterium]